MPIWLLLVTAVLASFRLTQFIVYDDGPWSLMLRIRARLGVYDYGPSGSPTSMVGRMFSCPHCIGLWVSLPLAWLVCGNTWVMLLCWWAIAGAQSFLEGRD